VIPLNEHDFMDLKGQVDRETAANETEHASFRRRLDKLEEAGKERTEMLLAIQRQGTAIENIGKKVGEIAVSVGDVKKRVDEIEQEPADTYKKLKYEIIKYIVLTVLGAFIGYFIKGA
jgi:hypothetical protein